MIKLYNGDCSDILKSIPDGSVDLILQDAPYNTTACKWEWDIMTKIDEFWSEWNRIIKPNGAIVMFGSEPFSSKLRLSNLKMYKYDWIWEKQQGTGHLNAKKQPLRKNELISVFYKKQCLYNPQIIGDEERTVKRNGKTAKADTYNKFIEIEESKYKGRYPTNMLKENTPKKWIAPNPKASGFDGVFNQNIYK